MHMHYFQSSPSRMTLETITKCVSYEKNGICYINRIQMCVWHVMLFQQGIFVLTKREVYLFMDRKRYISQVYCLKNIWTYSVGSCKGLNIITIN